jgi:hypothetical protein
MFPVEAFQRTVERFVAILRRHEILFHITGGSISSAYGEPRLTQDIDIVVSPEMAKKRLDDLIAAVIHPTWIDSSNGTILFAS